MATRYGLRLSMLRDRHGAWWGRYVQVYNTGELRSHALQRLVTKVTATASEILEAVLSVRFTMRATAQASLTIAFAAQALAHGYIYRVTADNTV